MATKEQPRYELNKSNFSETIISKLVQENTRATGAKKGDVIAPGKNTLQNISKEIGGNITDYSSIFEVLPDVELAMQVLVSSILSPKDMMSTELNFGLAEIANVNEGSGKVIKIVEEYFENTYKLKKLLPNILADVLFKRGSYPILVLPESSIDDVINSPARVSIESFSDQVDSHGIPYSLGILATQPNPNRTAGLSLESLHVEIPKRIPMATINAFTSVTDNPAILKMPEVLERVSQEAVRDRLNQMSKKPRSTNLYRKRTYRNSPIIPIQPPSALDRKNAGAPTVMRLPSESVIPVTVPGSADEHIGYYVLLDKGGHPLTNTSESKYYESLNQQLADANSGASELIAQTKEAMFGGNINSGVRSNQKAELAATYTSLIEADLLARLTNGVYGENVELANPEKVYSIMFSRALKKMHTTVLYVPIELMTYIAFDYNQLGVGKSLMEGSKIISSIRSVLLFSNTMASIKNSTSRTGLDITLDPDDPNPSATVETLLHEFTKNHQTSYPLGTTDPVDITKYLQRASVDLNVSGNTAYPETKVDVNDKARSVVHVDNELEESMKRRHIMSLGLSPETIDASMETDFATNLVGSNLLLAKRVLIYQDKLTGFLEEFVRKYIANTPTLYAQILEETDATGSGMEKEELCELLIESITVSLPSPDTAKLDNQLEAFNKYSDGLDSAIAAYISEAVIGDMLDSELVDSIAPTVASLKAYFQRKWLRSNNVLTELDTIIDPDGNFDLLENQDKHLEGLLKTLSKYMRKIRKEGRKFEKGVKDDEDKEAEAEEAKAAAEEEARLKEEEANQPPEDEATGDEVPAEDSDVTPEDVGAVEEPGDGGDVSSDAGVEPGTNPANSDGGATDDGLGVPEI